MEIEPMKNRSRHRRRSAGLPADLCLLCAHSAPERIRKVSLAELVEATLDAEEPSGVRSQLRARLQEHHLLGGDLAPDLVVPLCACCHANLHELLRDRGIDFRQDSSRSVLHVLEIVLRILAFVHAQLAQVLEALADRIAALIRALDSEFAGWRALPEAAQ